MTSNGEKIHVATVTAPTNIACIKYWGKANVKLNTPLNSSLSATISQDYLRAVTTASASCSFTSHRLWLNGIEEDITTSKRFKACLDGVLKLAGDKVDDNGYAIVKKEEWKNMHVHISSYNTFPTAAGLASSAAGYAALVAALSSLFCAKETFDGELSTIARQGSGSACRSLYGGFVAWEKGSNDNDTGSDSMAVQIANENHWPEFRALILVVSDIKKETSSTTGMQTSVATSSLIKHRAEQIVPTRMKEITKAILSKDFKTFAEITMKESNQFHATCLDTYPPIFYLNSVSKSIISLVHLYNDWAGDVRVAYTFDAGPNAVLYTLDKYYLEICALIKYCFLGDDHSLFVPSTIDLPSSLDPTLLKAVDKLKGDGVKKVYVTKCGEGPITLKEEDSLIDLKTGLNLYNP